MSKSDTIDAASSSNRSIADKRQNSVALLMLIQLDPSSIVDCLPVNGGYLAHEFAVAGEMRETCPECKTTHLKLVLLQNGVKRAHMFCEKCTRCFDACYPDGYSALL